MHGIALPQRGLVSQNDAAHIENAQVPRAKFINQWTRKTAFDAGWLVPCLLEEILPGDHMQYNITAYLRMATPIFPMFDNQRVDTHFFFVPSRLLWANWAKMMGEQDSPGDTIAFTVPIVPVVTNQGGVGGLYDHMGIPIDNLGAPILVNTLPFRAYNLIYNTWFRDENLQNAVPFSNGDGPDTWTDYVLRQRAKSHDYFTSALPWPQKFTAPTVPLLGTAPVQGIGSYNQVGATGPVLAYESGYQSAFYNYYKVANAPGVNDAMYVKMTDPVGGYPDIYADLALATGVSVNQLRQAFLVQQLLERDARGGTRYVELLRSHFGVINPDFRLQRPEYIGGGQSPLNITPIAQTAPTTGVPLGAIGGAGTAVGSHRASYAATEHGYIIGLISVKSELSYQQGLDRTWTRRSRYDFYWPTLAGLGEQAILRKEIFCVGTTNDDFVFGYQERWHEYRTRQSDVTGIMRSTATGTLDAWHLAQRFITPPLLNSDFIKDTPPMARVLAAGALATGQEYLCDIQYHRTAVRPVPTFGTPVTLGRF